VTSTRKVVGDDIEAFIHILANLVDRAAAAGAGLILNIDDLLDPFEMGTRSQAGCSLTRLLRGNDARIVQQVAEFQHGLNVDRKFCLHRDSIALEADALSEIEASVSQRAFSIASGRDHASSLVKQASDRANELDMFFKDYIILPSLSRAIYVLQSNCWSERQ
jgi:hypothetical protein